ncbi:MAG: endo-1,4-beta-xylanase [Sphingobacteriaceae bacterium]|nr:endo-1,4-beta-xylanase [Sphingobacteriaceae bacterium]
MKFNSLLVYVAIAATAVISSCKKDSRDGAFINTGNFNDTTGTLKSFASFPVGLSIIYTPFTTNTRYAALVKNEASSVTFGNELKNSSLVKADGTYDFSTADAFYAAASNAGLEVFGHTLVWHSQQRASYYKNLIGGNTSGPGITNLVVNPGFETTPGTGSDIAQGWQALNGASQFVITTTNTNSGSKALQANVPAGGQNFNTQIITRAQIPVTAGTTYTISYFIKGASAQNIQFEVRSFVGAAAGGINYQGGKPVTTTFTKVSYNYVVPANVTAIQLAFDLGGTANTIYIDDVSIVDASVIPPPSNAQVAAIVDDEMKKHIQTVAARYAGKIKAWDVINEPFTDGGADLRTNANTPAGARTDIFVWQDYLGRGYAAKAFQYARAADANADLYMNDFNLESSTTKLNAFVALANELKAANTGITGVGTQLHMSLNTPYSGIIDMMQKLASTGLKVRVSEFDIKLNPTSAIGYTPSATDLQFQAAMYKFVIATYIKYVPPAQRGGITFWGVDDTSSWYNTSANVTANKLDYPLLFDKNYAKKPAYAGVKQALQGKGEN